MTKDTPASSSSSRNYFRIPCELQIRWRIIDDEELKVFKAYAMRPSPTTTLKMELETQLNAMAIRDESKFLFQKAFQLLMNIDQRLERLEESLLQREAEGKVALEDYHWIHGDLGAGGLSYSLESAPAEAQKDRHALLDLLLPSLPEHRIVCAARVVHLDAKKEGKQAIGFEFTALHEDDREFIHRFVSQREREILRSRAQDREKKTP